MVSSTLRKDVRNLSTSELSGLIPEKFAIEEWRNFLNSFGYIKHINIDCYISTTSNPDDVLELHGCCDASKVAYCAATYTRYIYNSSVISSLLTAECSLVPNKDHTIPRLESLACLLLSFRMNTVIKSQSKPIKIYRILC